MTEFTNKSSDYLKYKVYDYISSDSDDESIDILEQNEQLEREMIEEMQRETDSDTETEERLTENGNEKQIITTNTNTEKSVWDNRFGVEWKKTMDDYKNVSNELSRIIEDSTIFCDLCCEDKSSSEYYIFRRGNKQELDSCVDCWKNKKNKLEKELWTWKYYNDNRLLYVFQNIITNVYKYLQQKYPDDKWQQLIYKFIDWHNNIEYEDLHRLFTMDMLDSNTYFEKMSSESELEEIKKQGFDMFISEKCANIDEDEIDGPNNVNENDWVLIEFIILCYYHYGIE